MRDVVLHAFDWPYALVAERAERVALKALIIGGASDFLLVLGLMLYLMLGGCPSSGLPVDVAATPDADRPPPAPGGIRGHQRARRLSPAASRQHRSGVWQQPP